MPDATDALGIDAPGIDAAARAVDEELVPRVAEMLDAVIGVGAALARSAAQATTSSTLPPVSQAPLQDIVRFGATAVGNLGGLVMDAARGGRRVVAARTPGATPGTAGVQLPRVTRGSTLRVPLLVENTGHAPTPEVAFTVAGVEQVDLMAPADARADNHDDVVGGGHGLLAADVTFSPAVLVIGPRDFEKLTVRITTSLDTEPGRYRVTVDGADGWFSTDIELDVIAD